MKFYKMLAQQNVRGLNLEFYPAGLRRRLFKSRKFSVGHNEQRKFSAVKFTRRAKFNAPKQHKNLKEKR